MKKLLLVSLCFMVLCLTQVFAQNRTVTGTVTAKDDGLPIPGVTVKIKGTTVGVPTDVNGKFSINAPTGSTLVFNFIGYATQDVKVTGAPLRVSLEASNNQLNEVVVNTAFGVKKTAGELGYTATTISNKELQAGGATNFTNGLTAKVAGLVVTTGDNGINPSTRFTLRGNRHIVGNNFALVVLNGVPISPNDVNTINPDDIESVDVLNGAAAAALYGSEGSNGVMSITTKKGSRSGAAQVVYTNTYQLEQLAYFPPLQNRFGSYGGEGPPFQDAVTGFITTVPGYENQSYGPAYDGHSEQLGIPLQDGTIQKYPYSGYTGTDPRKAFFNTGHSEVNNLAYNVGDAANSFNMSVNNLNRTGTTPNDTYKRSVVRIGATKTYGIFKADFTGSYTNALQSQIASTGLYGTLLNTPSWVPVENFKDQTQPFADRSTFFNSYDVNPYSYVTDSRQNDRSDSFNGSFTGTLTPSKWFDFTYRLASNFGNISRQTTARQVNYSAYALSNPGGTGNRASSAGVAIVPGTVANTIQFGDGSFDTSAGPQGYSRITQDAIANFHHTFFNDFKTNLRLGNTIWQEYLNRVSNGATQLLVQDFYNVSYSSGIPTVGQTTQKIRQIAYFGDLTVGYKDWANVEATIRNEHDSRLNDANRSVYFPSINASVVLSNAITALKDNKTISYLKLRGSFAQVGAISGSPYGYQPSTYGVADNFPYGSLAGLKLGTTLNNPNLKPEKTREVEFGVDLGLFDGRINGSATYYNNHTTNQTVSINTSPSIGYQNTLINAGDVQNNGFEFKLDVAVLTKAKNGVSLDLGSNFAIQNSKVISILPGVNSISLGSNEQALVGYAYPQLVANDVNRDPQGRVIVNANTGYPTTAATLVNLGRTTPKYVLGMTQNVGYKFITLTLTEEFRTGYVFYNGTERTAVLAGSAGFSASNGRERFIFPNSVINTGTTAAPNYVPNTNVAIADGNLNFWDSGSFYTVASTYTQSGAFWKLREADIAFDISQWAKKTKAIKRASISINGRNLLMLVPASNRFHADPEFSSSATNSNVIGTQSSAQLPPSRYYGATLNVTF